VPDFRLSRLLPNDVSHVSTAPQGSLGYLDPKGELQNELKPIYSSTTSTLSNFTRSCCRAKGPTSNSYFLGDISNLKQAFEEREEETQLS